MRSTHCLSKDFFWVVAVLSVQRQLVSARAGGVSAPDGFFASGSTPRCVQFASVYPGGRGLAAALPGTTERNSLL